MSLSTYVVTLTSALVTPTDVVVSLNQARLSPTTEVATLTASLVGWTSAPATLTRARADVAAGVVGVSAGWYGPGRPVTV